ncbi:MAG TPA: class I adenylate-forming enzyme family protein [Stellaceae bacterium]|nr:class I adenylate-forming enzyme family protein [Stellaceae bacterium]
MTTSTILTLLSKDRIEAYTASGHWRSETIYMEAAAHAERTPNAFAVRDRFRRLTYRELVGTADRLAADLARRGIRPGQRIAVWLPSRVETAVAMLACSRNSYICCPSFHRDHTVAAVKALIEQVRAAALLMQPGYGADADASDILAAVADLPYLKTTYRLPAPASGSQKPFAELAPGVAVPPSRDPNRVVYLPFTSGTTGEPKGVMHSDNTLLANARALARDWNFDARSVIYSLGPLSHNLGFGAMIAAIVAGGELVVHDLPRGASLLDRLVETGATFLFGVPTHAIDLLNEMRARGAHQLGAVKGFRISGAAAPSEVVAELMRRGVMPQSGYGMTETCSHQYTLPTDDPKLISETCGRACSGYEIRIWSQDNPDIEVPVGEIGQIGGRGASLMLGYFDDQLATEASFNAHGWFMTGDLGSLDANGFLRIAGRKKDIILRGGHNIYPARIEALAMRHRAIDKAAAFPVPDSRLGERVCLAVVMRPGETVQGDALLEHLAELGLSRYDMPEYLLVLDALPLTPSGKVTKRELVKGVEAGRYTPVPVRYQRRVA